MNEELARIEVHDMAIVWNGHEWQPAPDETDLANAATLAKIADTLSLHYSYGPADGQPGCALARDVARDMGGKAILPAPPLGGGGLVF